MKTAKEMFEELGYDYKEDDKLICYTLKQSYDENFKERFGIEQRTFGIVFNKQYKSWHSYIVGWDNSGKAERDLNMSINAKLHQAITQQMKDFGCLDD